MVFAAQQDALPSKLSGFYPETLMPKIPNLLFVTLLAHIIEKSLLPAF